VTRWLVGTLVLVATTAAARAQGAQPVVPADQPEAPPVPTTPAEPEPPAPPAPSPPPAPEAPAPAPALRPSPGPLDPTPTSSYPPLGAISSRSHADGFMFRFLFGVSGFAAETGHRSLSGGGFDLGLAAGYALRPDLILQLDGIIAGPSDPTYRVDGEEMDRNFSAGAYGLGPGATYYAKYNLYATGAVYASWLLRTETVDTPPVGSEEVREGSRAGIGASLAVGKEWWVSDSWGLGVAGRGFLASMRDGESDDSTWAVRSFSLLFSATMN
jgi:hypothetical protein